MALGILGPRDGIILKVNDVLVEKAWLSSVVLRWSLTEFTQNVGDGPIMVGVAHSDYTLAEIEAYLESTGSWDEGSLVDQEVAKRRIRRVGVFDAPASPSDTEVMNDNKPIRTKCGWQLYTGDTVTVWAYNLGTSALATTDPFVLADGHANLWPN